MTQIVSETKPFYLTSEFWLHNLLQLLLWVGALPTGGAPSWIKTVISGAAVIGYTLARGLAKAGVPRQATTQLTETEQVGPGKAASWEPPTEAEIAEATKVVGS